ncbi:hypothetical protein [Brevibacillus choshinensis]|nr:hypothetical protein [Brevibacillus choshinensis]
MDIQEEIHEVEKEQNKQVVTEDGRNPEKQIESWGWTNNVDAPGKDDRE